MASRPIDNTRRVDSEAAFRLKQPKAGLAAARHCKAREFANLKRNSGASTPGDGSKRCASVERHSNGRFWLPSNAQCRRIHSVADLGELTDDELRMVHGLTRGRDR